MVINNDHRLIGVESRNSPHFDSRPELCALELIVIHCISLPEGEWGNTFVDDLFMGRLDCEAHESFSDLRSAKVSPHVFIDRAGKVTQYVPFNKRAWHAGISQWNGRQDCNNFSVGIELEGTIARDYTSDQYLVLNELLAALISNYGGLGRDSIVGHQEIAPGRKVDPGPYFSWKTLAQALS